MAKDAVLQDGVLPFQFYGRKYGQIALRNSEREGQAGSAVFSEEGCDEW